MLEFFKALRCGTLRRKTRPTLGDLHVLFGISLPIPLSSPNRIPGFPLPALPTPADATFRADFLKVLAHWHVPLNPFTFFCPRML
jgi:hypothetical protein